MWRWVWLARIQYDVQQELRDEGGLKFWSKLPWVLWVRVVAHVAFTWGGLIVFPAFYGLFLGGFAGPLMFESTGSVFRRLKECLSWVHHAGKRLFRVTLVMTLFMIVLPLAAFVGQMILGQTVLPSVLGIDTVDLNLTINSAAWRLRVGYFLFLLIDAYWTVACVFLYYDSQSRRLASDLRVRLMDVVEEGVKRKT